VLFIHVLRILQVMHSHILSLSFNSNCKRLFNTAIESNSCHVIHWNMAVSNPAQLLIKAIQILYKTWLQYLSRAIKVNIFSWDATEILVERYHKMPKESVYKFLSRNTTDNATHIKFLLFFKHKKLNSIS